VSSLACIHKENKIFYEAVYALVFRHKFEFIQLRQKHYLLVIVQNLFWNQLARNQVINCMFVNVLIRTLRKIYII